MTRCLWLVVLTLLAACAQPPAGLYDWSTYSRTLYRYQKEPTPEHLATRIGVLQQIIGHANQSGKKVPPGIYAELGYLRAQQGNSGEAQQLYALEGQTWPESQVLMKRLQTQGAQQGGGP